MSGVATVFTIRYLDPLGKLQRRKVEARSELEALQTSRIPKTRVRKISANKIDSFLSNLNKQKPSLDIQANVLNLFSVIIGSGAPVAQSFDKIASGYEIFRPKLPAVKAVDKVSEKMKILHFDAQIILLAEIGEKTNTLSEVMAGAADDMIDRQKVMGDIKKALVPAIVIVIFGILSVIGLPLFMVEDLIDIMDSPGIKFEANITTTMLVWLGVTVPKIWHAMIIVTVLIGATVKLWWPFVRRFPVLSIIDDFFKQGAAYAFISAFLPLYKRGIPMLEAVEMVRKMAKGEAKRAYDALSDHLSKGGAVSTGFEHQYWYPQLRQAMSGFDDIQDSGKAIMLSKMKPLLTGQISKSGGRITAIFGGLGMVLALGVSMLVFMGMMWPMMTMGVK